MKAESRGVDLEHEVALRALLIHTARVNEQPQQIEGIACAI
jgi:hypothetical protein